MSEDKKVLRIRNVRRRARMLRRGLSGPGAGKSIHALEWIETVRNLHPSLIQRIITQGRIICSYILNNIIRR
jgi:hypothetical protein